MRLALDLKQAIDGFPFPYFFVGTFIEAHDRKSTVVLSPEISLLFRRDFH